MEHAAHRHPPAQGLVLVVMLAAIPAQPPPQEDAGCSLRDHLAALASRRERRWPYPNQPCWNYCTPCWQGERHFIAVLVRSDLFAG
jgi:hypothetical protein